MKERKGETERQHTRNQKPSLNSQLFIFSTHKDFSTYTVLCFHECWYSYVFCDVSCLLLITYKTTQKNKNTRTKSTATSL